MNSEKMNANQNKKYLENHKITKIIEEMMGGLMKEKPEEPFTFMLKFIQQKAQQNGIFIPSQFKVETSTSLQDDLRSEGQVHSRSYEKPWLTNSNKKLEPRYSPHQDVTNDASIPTINPCIKEEDNLIKEFSLVESVGNDIKTIEQDKLEEYRKQRMVKDSSNTKEKLLEILNDEAIQKNIDKIKLENKKNEKELICEGNDCAVELAEDQNIYQNELNFAPAVVNTPNITVVFRKEVTEDTGNVGNGLNLSMCPNCTKLYQPGERNGSVVQYSSSINSVILDDLESASQVNGPRRISDTNHRQSYQSGYSKKISVTDIETTAKAWPVMETSSELSMNRKNIQRSKPSSRHFQS